MATGDEDRTRRAALANELGFFPATLDPVDIERHRRLNAVLDEAPTKERLCAKFAHIREENRRSRVEAQGSADIADLYNDL